MVIMEKALLCLTLAACILFISFGHYALLLCVYLLAFISGGLAVAFHFGKQTSSLTEMRAGTTYRRSNHLGIEKVKKMMEPATSIENFDKRMTGASGIDDVLQEVLEYTVRDYIKTWYRQISNHDGFLVNIWQCAQKVIITFSNKSKEIDWTPYFTQRLVDDFASHIRLYRRAAEKSIQAKNEDNVAALESAFFDMEVEMESNLCRDLICLESKAERQYLQDLSDVLLFLLLPREDFNNKPFHSFIREVLVDGIFLPTMDLLSDPDYINQYIAWMCYETSFTRDTFLTVIRSSDSTEELEAVRDKVDSDIAKCRSKDTGGSDDAAIKQNLNSLMFLRDACDMRLRHLIDFPASSEQLIDETDNVRSQSLSVLTLDEIFNSATALQSFFEYLSNQNAQQYLFFYLNVEGFRTAAEQQIAEVQKLSPDTVTTTEPDLESLRKAANMIFDQYLSDKSTSSMKIEIELIKETVHKMNDKMLSEDIFDSVQARVYQILQCDFYEDFIQSSAYIKLLGDMGLLSNKGDDGDNVSFEDDGGARADSECSLGSTEDLLECEESGLDTVPTDLSSPATSAAGESYLFVQISQTGIVKDSEKGGKKYAIFAITVHKKEPFVDEVVWDVYRRYSDFHDLHMILTEKFPELAVPHLPGKTVLKNTSQAFLEKRKRDLDKYLKALMKPELLQSVNGLQELLNQFLHTGIWEYHKSEFSRKMDTIVHPIKSASKSMGNVVKSVPDSMYKIGDGLGKVFSSQKSLDQIKAREMMNQLKVGASLDPEAGENIPLRIMLLLMDEVFDLRHKNQWLRRRIGAILRQLIKATFGDKINRKIVEHVDFMTSSDQMAEYMTAFKNSFWPNGVLAEPRPLRDEPTKMRTQVLCKAKMLGSVPDEVRTLMGTDAVRKGVARMFQMFQYKTLNKRILYVILEGVLITLFPDNKFQELFCKLHCKSARAKKFKQRSTSANDTLPKQRTWTMKR